MGSMPLPLPYAYHHIMRMKVLLGILTISSYVNLYNLYRNGDWLSILAAGIITVALVLEIVNGRKHDN